MRAKKMLMLITTVTIALSSLTGCSVPGKTASKEETKATETVSESTETTSGGKTLHYAILEDPPTADPQMANSMYVTTLCYHIFDGLMRNEDGKVVPAGAESYDLSTDGLVYTFQLRKDAKWSDGTGVVAGDYEYGIKRLMDPATASPFSFIGACLKNGTHVNEGKVEVDELGVKAKDEYTLEITLEYPAAYFPSMLSTAAFMPTRKDIVEKYGKDFAATAEQNVYNGPYVLANWEHGNKITLSKNENYWNTSAVKLDSIEISTIPDSSTQVGMYEAGDLDYVELPSEMAANYPESTSFYTGSVEYLQLNLGANDYLANANFRKAMNAAISREEFVQLTSTGINEVQDRFVLPIVSGAQKTYEEEYPLDAFEKTNNPDKMEEYLNVALSELGISDPSQITLVLSCGDADSKRKASEVLQNQLQGNLGIKVEVTPMAYKQLYENLDKNDFEMMLTGWTPDYPDPNAYLELFESSAAYNHCQYSNPKYDTALQKAQQSIDPKQRFDALFEAEKIFCEDLPVIPLHLVRKNYLLNEKVTDFKPYFVGTSYNYVGADITK